MIGRHITRILDTLWVNHLENLKSLRTSVSIRAYAQHEPIVEYRREAYKLYQILKSEFKNFVFKSIFTIFDVDMEKINDSLEKNKEFIKNKKPNKIKNSEGEKIGRNDKCWCGSGKKYKHCHGK
jgi:preprotein translocase subunit SecA